MKGLLVVMGVLGVLSGARVGYAQEEREEQGAHELRLWTGLSLGTQASSVSRRMFSSGGLSYSINASGNRGVDLYVDTLQLVDRPVALGTFGSRVSDIVGSGFAWTYYQRDAAGTRTFFGYGLGLYRDRTVDNRFGPSTSESTGVGGKVFFGTSIGGPYFFQGQLTVLEKRRDFQLGVGRRF